MSTLYLVALAFGGTLLLASLVLGGHHHDGDQGGDDVHGDGVFAGWLPVASLRFWTFLLAFGGATGTLLTYLTDVGRGWTALAAFLVGWLSGVAVVAVVRVAERGVDSEVTSDDLRGETAQVMVAIAPGNFGKVRLSIKGRTIDLAAEADRAFAVGSKVMIVGDAADGRVEVTAA